MNELQIFNNPEFGNIRTIEINEKIYFVGIDIAKALGYKNTRDAILKHCRWVVKHDIPHPQSPTKKIEVNIIPEGDIYRLVANSELSGAEKFESWIFDDILPCIRRHGTYMTPEVIEKVLSDPDTIIQLATQVKQEREKRKELEIKIKKLEPAAEFGNTIGNCEDSSILIRDYAKLLHNDNINIGQNKLFAWFEINGYTYREKDNSIRPYQQYINMGLFTTKETMVKTNNHGDKLKITIRITGKGQQYFYKKIKDTYKKGA